MGEPLDRAGTEVLRLGSYEILGKLARGGMAELFLATMPDDVGKIVVIKKILPKYAANPKFVKLFLDEARLAAGLDHPHIARVYDTGTSGGNHFFAMEYIHGKDVRSTMKRTTAAERRFPIEHAVMIARDTAAALHYAHERRRPDGTLLDIVHRDVSPSNILISYDGEVKLVDFGVAKAASNLARTRTGTLKGKIAYMSPEQARGAPLDRRSDLFSLGIVLWEMVPSCRLCRTDNDLATIQMIINSRPQPPRELTPECPPELERIVLKALAAAPAARYQTAEELQLDLDELVRTRPIVLSPKALRDFMHKAFEPEIDAWREAQEAGHTVIEAAMFSESSTPASEGEHEREYFDEDLEPDEEDPESSIEGSIEGTIDGSIEGSIDVATIVRADRTMPVPSDITTPVPADLTAPIPEEEPATLVPGRGSPRPVPLDAAIEPRTTPWSARSEPAPLPLPPVMLGRLDQTPVPALAPRPTASIEVQLPEGQFPRAPKEWLRVDDPPPSLDEPMLRHWRRIKIGAAVLLVLIVLIAVIFSGGAPHSAVAPPTVPHASP